MSRSAAALAAITSGMFMSVSGVQAAVAESVAPGPVVRITKEDTARARAVVLRPGDVFSNFSRATSPERQPTIAHCNGYPGNRSDITVTGEARSVFKLRGYSIGSTVLWFKTNADATRYWTKTVRSQYIRCRTVGLELTNGAGEFVKPYITQAGAIPLRPTGAEKAVAYRFIAGVPSTPGAGNDSYNYIDTNVFIKQGRGIALLRTVWITSPCSCYQDLARLLAARLRAAS